MEIMILNVFLNLIIMGLWLATGAMSYSYFISQRHNHYNFRSIFSISSLNLFQSVLAMYFILTGDSSLQEIRWMIFSFLEILMMFMLVRTTSIGRPSELMLTSVFMVMVLISTVYFNLVFNLLISVMLVYLAHRSTEPIIQKYYAISMATYGMTSVIPVIFGFTGAQSLAMGCIFSWTFLWASLKIYRKEKINDKLKEMIIDGKL